MPCKAVGVLVPHGVHVVVGLYLSPAPEIPVRKTVDRRALYGIPCLCNLSHVDDARNAKSNSLQAAGRPSNFDLVPFGPNSKETERNLDSSNILSRAYLTRFNGKSKNSKHLESV
jgi:hypothetical protein